MTSASPPTTTVPPAPDVKVIMPSLVIVPAPAPPALKVPEPAKVYDPPARLLTAPASVTVPLFATLNTTALLIVLPVPASVDPTPTLIIPLFRNESAVNIWPASMVIVPLLV